MFKVSIASVLLVVILVVDSVFMQSRVLSILDFAGIFVLLVWFNLSARSQEGAWMVCLAASAIFGIFHQRNLGELILALTLSLIAVTALSHLITHGFDYHIMVILTFFMIMLVFSVISGAGVHLTWAVAYIALNAFISYMLQVMINRRVERGSVSNLRYK